MSSNIESNIDCIKPDKEIVWFSWKNFILRLTKSPRFADKKDKSLYRNNGMHQNDKITTENEKYYNQLG